MPTHAYPQTCWRSEDSNWQGVHGESSTSPKGGSESRPLTTMAAFQAERWSVQPCNGCWMTSATGGINLQMLMDGRLALPPDVKVDRLQREPFFDLPFHLCHRIGTL